MDASMSEITWVLWHELRPSLPTTHEHSPTDTVADTFLAEQQSGRLEVRTLNGKQQPERTLDLILVFSAIVFRVLLPIIPRKFLT